MDAVVNLLLRQGQEPAVIQVRHQAGSVWSVENPVLEAGEFGLDTDNSFFKIGDGTSRWSEIPYTNEVINSQSSTSTTAAASAAALKQLADTVAALGGGGGGGGGGSFILSTIFTEKGDLISATANNAPARVGVGSDGTVLTADSAAAAGVSWKSQDEFLAYIYFN